MTRIQGNVVVLHALQDEQTAMGNRGQRKRNRRIEVTGFSKSVYAILKGKRYSRA